jgi:hypothetical protein
VSGFVLRLFRSSTERRLIERRMRAIGLPDFETEETVAKQHERRIRRLRRNGILDDNPQMERCADFCELPGFCPAACCVKLREYRARLLPEATKLLFGYSRRVFSVTVVHPRYQVAAGKLSRVSIKAFAQYLARRLKKLENDIGSKLVAIGGIEATLDARLDGKKLWSPHAHLVVWGDVTAKQLRTALMPSKKFRREDEKPVVVKSALAPGRALGYATKRRPQMRQAYTSKTTGRQHRRKIKLLASALHEHDHWLLSIPWDEPFFLYGVREVHNKLMILRRKKVTSAKPKEGLR